MNSIEIKKSILDLIFRYNSTTARYLHDFSGNIYESFVELFRVLPSRYYVNNLINIQETINNFAKQYDCFYPEYSLLYRTDAEGNETKEEVFGTILVFDEDKDGKSGNSTVIEFASDFCHIHSVLPYEALKSLIVLNREAPPCEAYWVTKGSSGFVSKQLTVNKVDFDVKSHYNDDFDYNKITSFIESDESGLIIMYGASGTGKTFLIRHLALTYPNKTFYFMDKATFAYIMDPTFIDFLEDAENSVFVLEDCESLLMDRASTGNELMSTILNLSDGILGDSMKIKFICTFNANLSSIDKALLRKGRLKYKYEFKALTPKKTEELAILLDKDIPIGKSLTVCDIYNWDEDNNNSNKQTKIGFGHG